MAVAGQWLSKARGPPYTESSGDRLFTEKFKFALGKRPVWSQFPFCVGHHAENSYAPAAITLSQTSIGFRARRILAPLGAIDAPQLSPGVGARSALCLRNLFCSLAAHSVPARKAGRDSKRTNGYE